MKIISFPNITKAFDFLDTISKINELSKVQLYKAANIVSFDELDSDGTPSVVVTEVTNPQANGIINHLVAACEGKHINEEFKMLLGSRTAA